MSLAQLTVIHNRLWDSRDTPSPVTVKSGMSILKIAFENGLHKLMFDFPEFMDRLNTMKKRSGNGVYAPSARKNYMQAICRVQKYATDEEVVSLFLEYTDTDRHVTSFLNNRKISLQAKANSLRTRFEPFQEANRSNYSTSRTSRVLTELTQKEKSNWIHFKDIQTKFNKAVPVIMGILKSANPSTSQMKIVYFWTFLSVTALVSRTGRADASSLMHRNYGTDNPYIDTSTQEIVIQQGNKTKRTYRFHIPDKIYGILKRLIALSEAKGLDHIFLALDSQASLLPSSVIELYFRKISQSVLGVSLTVNLVRKIVATHDYRVWMLSGAHPAGLLQLADKQDHSLENHIKTYVHPEMFET
ncbi:MAG: hypothetical protein JWO77_3904 [Ilumatobacteraceae bacterium]|nr:hypothetical protein [Ilumatobacteraceae bacterium]MDB5177434.1 hypothetical protein [Candidatus Saccharibacteria bacterium]